VTTVRAEGLRGAGGGGGRGLARAVGNGHALMHLHGGGRRERRTCTGCILAAPPPPPPYLFPYRSPYCMPVAPRG
jgi:hypothetical protein